ncbi:MAG: hypothetical protein V3U52_08935 [Thermoplasmata archaeon]
MARPTEELLREVQRLKEEIAQLREMVTALFGIVFEEMEEEGPAGMPPREDDFSMHN